MIEITRAESHRAEVARAFLEQDGGFLALVAATDAGEIIGFAEAALRGDYVNGCETTPVTFLEGIYVEPSHRRTGVARALCLAVEAWGRAAGSREMASDADIANAAGQAFHTALGFEETERVVFFRRVL